jgi:cell division protein FtsI/penicillin-binding protein 2
VVDPSTGAVLAMCSSPTFDPNRYGNVESVAAYDNDALLPYESGSVMKPAVMAAAIDSGVVTPQTTFDDPGQIEIGGFTIKNAADKRWGRQTMVGVLERSINTGMVFVAQRLGAETMHRYLSSFGFGQPTGLTLPRDLAGDISSLENRGEIYPATASYGQGITVNVVQLAMAYAAIANGGTLLKPYVVAEVIGPDGTRDITTPTVVRRVLKPETAKAVGAMLASVIANGTTRLARIPGYWVAGKTGTAQLPDPSGGYYDSLAIHTVAGFVPVDRPVAWAESSAAPLFAEVTSAALRLLRIPPDAP